MKPSGSIERLLALHQDRRNVAGLGIVVTYALLAGALTVAVRFPSPATWAVAFAVVGFMQYRIVMSCHEAVHKTLLFPEALNECVGLFHASMVGLNFARYRRQHQQHHAAHHVGTDPDAYIYGPVLRATPGLHRLWVWLGGTFAEVVEKFQQKSFTLREDAAIRRAARTHSLAIMVSQVLLLVTLTLVGGWWTYPVLWLLPLLTVAVFLNRTRVIIEHCLPHILEGVLPRDVDDAEQRTVDVLTNPVERFLLAPFSFNHHYSHHRIQTIPHYNNERLSHWLDENNTGFSHRLRASYFSLLGRILWDRPLAREKLPASFCPKLR